MELEPGWYYLSKGRYAVGRIFYIASIEGKWYHVTPSIELYTNGALYDPDEYLNTTIEKESIPLSKVDFEERRHIMRRLLSNMSRVVDKRAI